MDSWNANASLNPWHYYCRISKVLYLYNDFLCVYKWWTWQWTTTLYSNTALPCSASPSECLLSSLQTPGARHNNCLLYIQLVGCSWEGATPGNLERSCIECCLSQVRCIMDQELCRIYTILVPVTTVTWKQYSVLFRDSNAELWINANTMKDTEVQPLSVPGSRLLLCLLAAWIHGHH